MNGWALLAPAILLACERATPSVEGAWGYAPITGEAGIYFTLVNPGPAADTVTGVSSPSARGAMLHRSVPGALVTMEHVARLPLPPGQRVELAPGGLHVMLTGLVSSPAPGDTLQLTISFAIAPPMTVQVPLVAYGDPPPAPRR